MGLVSGVKHARDIGERPAQTLSAFVWSNTGSSAVFIRFVTARDLQLVANPSRDAVGCKPAYLACGLGLYGAQLLGGRAI